MSELSHMVLEQRLRIDVTSNACQLDLECAEFLRPAPKGIYLRTRLEPVMVDGKNYYTRSGDIFATEQVLDVNLCNENIYDEQNRLVIPKSYLLKRERHLSNDPFMPYRAFKIIECMANATLDGLLAYRGGSSTWDGRSLDHVREDLLEIELPLYDTKEAYDAWEDRKAAVAVFKDELYQVRDRAFQTVKQVIELFVGKLTWHMYHISLHDNELWIERFCDYRVHLWEIEHGKKFRGEPADDEEAS